MCAKPVVRSGDKLLGTRASANLARACNIPDTLRGFWQKIPHAPKPDFPRVSPAERIRQFVQSCRGRIGKQRMEILVQDELAYLRKRYQPTSVATMVTDYRRALAASKASHPALEFFRLTHHETDALRQRARNKVVANQRAPREVVEPVQLIEKAIRLVTSPRDVSGGQRAGKLRWQDLAVGLAVLTGRRPIELMATGQFAPVPRHPFKARFRGQAKTREAAGTRTDWYVIPLLAPYKVVADGLRRLRASMPNSKSLADMPHDALHNSFSTSLNRAVAAEFPGFRPYDMRAVYALLCFTLYAPDAVQQIVYYSDILGHKLLGKPEQAADTSHNYADTQTACYYLRFYLSEENRRALKDQGRQG